MVSVLRCVHIPVGRPSLRLQICGVSYWSSKGSAEEGRAEISLGTLGKAESKRGQVEITVGSSKAGSLLSQAVA